MEHQAQSYFALRGCREDLSEEGWHENFYSIVQLVDLILVDEIQSHLASSFGHA